MATAPYKCMFHLSGGTVLLNQQIPNTTGGPPHPHLFCKLIPTGQIKAAIVLHHGAGGVVPTYAQQMLLQTGQLPPTVATVNWGNLQTWKTAVWIPQGNYCQAANAGPWNPNGVTAIAAGNAPVYTWANGTMWSGWDDPEMARDVPAAMVADYGSGIIRVMGGHSNGGMFTQRRYMEHVSGGFNVYCTSSGPFTNNPIVTHTFPGIVKPFFSVYGYQDTIVDILGGPAGPGYHFFDPTLQQATDKISLADVTQPTLWEGPFVRFQAQVNAYRAFKGYAPQTILASDGVTTNIVTGNPAAFGAIGSKTIWQDSTISNQLVLVADADHHVRTIQKYMHQGIFGMFMGHAFNNPFG